MPKSSRTAESKLRDVYARLIQINQEMFADAEYDIAYHVLAGALHCAATLREINYLAQLEHLADDQLAWIDAHDPDYEHSTQSSARRGLTSIYKNLSKMAVARVAIIQNEAKHRHD